MGFCRLIALFVFLLCLSVHLSAAPLKVHFIDVGQGDAIFIESPSGKNMLIDAGDDGDNAGEKVLTYLSSLGVHKINTFLLTHPHDDHYGGLLAMIGQVTIDKFYYGTHVDGKKYMKMVKKLKDEAIPYRHVSKGFSFDLGSGVSALTIHSGPQELRGIVSTVDVDGEDDGRGPDLNRCSVVVRLTYGASSYLLTGDATKHVEEKLLSEGANVRAIVYKAAHHGSRYSNTAEFLAAVKPRWGVIQVGAGNHHGHPHAPALQRMEDVCERVYRNDTGGTIYSYTDGSTCVINERPYPIVPQRPSHELPIRGTNQDSFSFSQLFTDPPLPLQRERSKLSFSVSSTLSTPSRDLTIELYDRTISKSTMIGSLDNIDLPANGMADLQLPYLPNQGGKRNLYVLVKDSSGQPLACHAYSVTTSRRLIVVDKSHGNYQLVTHQLAAFLTDLKRLGYDLRFNDGEITDETLQDSSALLLLGPNAPYTDSETSAIAHFLQNGGGLAVTSLARSASRSVAPLLESLQSTVTLDGPSEGDSDKLAELNGNWSGGQLPSSIYLPQRGSLSVDGPDGAEVLARADGKPVIAAEKMGLGRLIVGSGELFGNGAYRNLEMVSHESPEANRVLLHWLTGRFQQEQGRHRQERRKLNWSHTLR